MINRCPTTPRSPIRSSNNPTDPVSARACPWTNSSPVARDVLAWVTPVRAGRRPPRAPLWRPTVSRLQHRCLGAPPVTICVRPLNPSRTRR